MRTGWYLILSLILTSCCSPHFVGYVNPLYLQEVGKEKYCQLTPCPPQGACPGAYKPWLNLEYERSNQELFKIGATFMGYTPNSMLNISGNFLTDLNGNNQKGIGITSQFGFLRIKSYYTTFIGAEYNYFISKTNYGQIQPNIGFAPPIPILNSFLFKTSYQFNNPNQKNYWTVGINFKTPIYPLFN